MPETRLTTNTNNTNIDTTTARRSRWTPKKPCFICATTDHPRAPLRRAQRQPSPPPPRPEQPELNSKSLNNNSDSCRHSNHGRKTQIPRGMKPQQSVVQSSGLGSIIRTQQVDNAVAAAAAYATRDFTYAPLHLARQTTSLLSEEVNYPPTVGVLVATHPKVASSSPASDSSGHKNTRNKGPDGTMAIVRGRQACKVQKQACSAPSSAGGAADQ